MRATDERLNDLEQACRSAERVWFGFDPTYRRKVEDALGLRRGSLRDERVSIYTLGEQHIAACGSVRVCVPVYGGTVGTHERVEVPRGYGCLTKSAVAELTEALSALLARRLGLHHETPVDVRGMVPSGDAWVAIVTAGKEFLAFPIVGWSPNKHGSFDPVVISDEESIEPLSQSLTNGERFLKYLRREELRAFAKSADSTVYEFGRGEIHRER